jgi:uncharacterized lipoprotein YehR (DUF1307 family)
MKKYFSLFLALVALFVVSSCSDDDSDASRTDLLTSKSWVVTKYEVEVSGQSIDLTEDYMDCEGDNVITFSKDGKYNQTAGTNTCNGDEESETGTWALKNSDKTIVLTVDGDVVEIEIHSLSSSTLKVKQESVEFDTNGDGVDDTEVPFYVTLSAQ